uniref:HIT-type domain-containing protein n=2 Tax=Macrostomum lignano TaxID=282301 RepID=A0A1I8H1E9_9PLAT
LQPAMVDAGVSSRLRETRRLVLDEAARQRRHRRALEALEADNFQADPHADLRVSKLAPKFSDEASSFGPSRDALGGVAASADGKKSRKAKAAGGSGAVGTLGGRLRRNFAALLEEELARRAQLPGASASGSAATPYELAQVGPSRLPPRHFCAVCGLLGPHTCVVCGTRFCSASCYSTHQDTRCLNSPQPTMCSLSRCLHELTSRQPVEEFHQLVSLSTLHTLLTSQPDGSDLTAGQRPISGKQPAVLIDLGDSLRWICGPRTGWLCGCDWRGLRLNLAARLRDFQASLFLPMPLLPGDGGASHCDKLDWAAEQRGRKHRVATIIRYLRELQPAAGAQAQQTWPRPAFSLWLPPPGLVTALRFCLRRLEVPCQQSLDSRLAECARISTNIGCRAIASDSPLCWLLQPPNRSLLLLNSLSPAGGRAFHGYQQLQMRQALLPRLCGLLGLSADRLPMLACLLTDRFLPADCLQKLHLELAPECSSEPRQARLRSVALAVAKIVAGFSSPDAVDEALKLLEPHAASEEERSGLRRQIEAGLAFYGPCCSPATAQDPKSPPAPVDACIEGHKFDPWLVSRAKELHLSGRLHPWVAQVLHYREVRIELGFEDPPQPEAAELDDRLELTVDLFADIRARAYLLLYDIRRAEEDINCSAAAVRETVCRQERGLTTSTVLMTTARFEKGLKQLELPLCAELWGRVGQAGDGVRTTAFLACMHGWRLADPLCAQPLLDPAAVPPGLFLPLS